MTPIYLLVWISGFMVYPAGHGLAESSYGLLLARVVVVILVWARNTGYPNLSLSDVVLMCWVQRSGIA